MKTLVAILVLLVLPSFCWALDVPPLRAHVNDYAGMLSPEASQRMESQLKSFERSDSTQIAVLTIPSLEGDSLEDFSIRVAEAWKIGQKGKDNGAILLIVKKERKIRIEVGRGLEGKLTDLVSGRIIRNDMAPQFKAGNFDGGVMAGVAAIMSVVKGEYKGDNRAPARKKKGSFGWPTMLIFLLVACVALGSFSKVLGGVAGAAGLPIAAYVLSSGLGPVVLLVLGVVGFLGGLFLSFLFGGGGRGGGFGGGPFFGGGYGGGSFGDSGGGFSGGGGDFGGGGASGDW